MWTLSPVLEGNVWQLNKIKLCVVTKHFLAWTPCFCLINSNANINLITQCKTFSSFGLRSNIFIPFGYTYYTSASLVTKHCWIVFHHQTFPVWTGLNDYALDSRPWSGPGLSPEQLHSIVLVQSILLSVPLSTQVNKGCNEYLLITCSKRGDGKGLTWDYHPIKGVGREVEMLQHLYTVVALH